MKIALINASPKKTESASSTLINDLRSIFPTDYFVKEFIFNKPLIAEAEISELQEFSIWVFAFSLYVDSLPSHLLSCLCQLEEYNIAKDIRVYAIVNCGFFEGIQTRNALSIMENWSTRLGLKWGMGIGYGGGGGLSQMQGVPLGKGPKSALGKAYAVFGDAIATQSNKENIYASISVPRFLFKIMAEMYFKNLIKKNGGKVKDLSRII